MMIEIPLMVRALSKVGLMGRSFLSLLMVMMRRW